MHESPKNHTLVDDARTPRPENSSLRMWPMRLPDDSASSAGGVVVGAEEMNRDVRLVADYPTVVRHGWNVKQVACTQLDDVAVVEGRRRRTRHDQSDVSNNATRGTRIRADVVGPLPPRLVASSAESEPAQSYDLEPSFGELPYLIGLLERFSTTSTIYRPPVSRSQLSVCVSLAGGASVPGNGRPGQPRGASPTPPQIQAVTTLPRAPSRATRWRSADLCGSEATCE